MSNSPNTGANVTGTNTGANVTGTGGVNSTFNDCDVAGVVQNIYTGKDDVAEIQKRTRDDINLWTQDTLEPAVLSKVLDKIQTNHRCVTIKGSPGEGKTTLGFLALRKLQESRTVYKVSSPKEFDKVIKTSAPVVLLDDAFGQTIFDKAAWEKWRESLERFKEMKELNPLNETGNIIIIGRDFVLKSGSRNTESPWDMLMDDENVVNISSEVVKNTEEKHNMLLSIAKRYNFPLDSNTIKTICSINIPHGFPHTCKLFITLSKKDRRLSADEFFSNPLEFLKMSLNKLITNKEVIANIFMEIIKGDGHVVKSELVKCGPNYIRTANDLCPTYIKPEGNGYVFDHPSILDTVAFLMCETNLPLILERCSMEFITERVWLDTPDGEKRSETGAGAKLMAEIPWDEAEELARRFAKEIAAGNLRDVTLHNTWHSDRFVMLLLKSMTGDQLNAQHWSGWLPGGGTILHHLCWENRAACVKMFVQRGGDVNIQTMFGYTPLHMAAINAAPDSARVLLEFDVDVNKTDKFGVTALDLATQRGHSETASVLRAAVDDISIIYTRR